jgi:hypothetical protein
MKVGRIKKFLMKQSTHDVFVYGLMVTTVYSIYNLDWKPNTFLYDVSFKLNFLAQSISEKKSEKISYEYFKGGRRYYKKFKYNDK